MQQISDDVMLKMHNKANKYDRKKNPTFFVEYGKQSKIVKVRVDVYN